MVGKLFILFVFFVPTISVSAEGLFYFFNNKNGLNDFKKNYEKIDVVAPQIYEVEQDLSISKPLNKKIISEAKRKSVPTMPLIVQDKFDKVLMSTILIAPSAQDRIIDFMIKEAKKQKYIGWQFDFENINHLDRDMYSDFVAKTYKKMKENNLQFSVAVIVRDRDYDRNSKNQDWSSAYDYKKLAANSDFLSLMTYDDPRTEGPVASIPYVNRILNYITKLASAEKLSLGIPFYCYVWQDGKKIGAATYEIAEKNYKKAKKGKLRGFDEKYGAEFFKYVKDKKETTVWCDNEQSFKLKQEIISERGMCGYSVWALGQGDKKIWLGINNIIAKSN